MVHLESVPKIPVNPAIGRIGRFRASKDLVEAKIFPLLLDWLGFVPVKVEFLYAGNCLEYTGFSSQFREVAQAEVAPCYRFHVKQDQHEVGTEMVTSHLFSTEEIEIF